MLGLLQCSVPPVLKAELLHSLAAFGKSPEIAASLWQSLEYTQVDLNNFNVPFCKVSTVTQNIIYSLIICTERYRFSVCTLDFV